MTSISKQSPLWQYLSIPQRDLIDEGNYLVEMVGGPYKHTFKDYSFLVFPYAKAYEGFLKQLFLDVGFISQVDYVSDHFRLGKFLSPNLMQRLEDKSLYRQVIELAGEDLAEDMWRSWKLGRNQIFHYYPHNIKGITFGHAQMAISELLTTMDRSYKLLALCEAQRSRHEYRTKLN